jgi:chorismate-pyruvate lyase
MPSAARLVRFRPASRARRATAGILYPLDYGYALAGLTPPTAREIEPEDIPDPYRALLAHDDDMTQTLERHTGGPVVVRPLSAGSRGRWYFRRVLLAEEATGRPIEMGAIRIALDLFGVRVRSRIVRGEAPLGRILREAGVDYRSRPERFLTVTPNAEMLGVFWMREPQTLYGRQTVMTLDGKHIGQIVEVLPPL